MRILRTLALILFGALSAFMFCLLMRGEMIPDPYFWIAGLLLSLFLLILAISHTAFCEIYTKEKFEALWIRDRNKQKGLCYHDKPGCYVILIYRFYHFLPFRFG